MSGTWVGIANSVLGLIYPPACAACGSDTSMSGDAVICPECVKSLVKLDGSGCGRCASPLEADQPCAFCLRLDESLDLLRSAFWFMGSAPALMHRMKYGGWHVLARTAAELMLASPSCAEALAGIELIAPVPLHPWRQLRRGYNQSEKLAREIAILTGIQFAPDLAVRQRRTRSQTSLNPEESKRNVTGAFKVMDHTLCWGRSVCIVDDVMTTGPLQAHARRP